MRCSECGASLPSDAVSCPACGYPVIVPAIMESEDPDTARASLMEYKLIQLLGVVVFAVGIVAALADTPIAATIPITVGAATYMTGLLGCWWNRRD